MKRHLLLAYAAAVLLFVLPFNLGAQETKKPKSVKAPAVPFESFSGSINVGVGESITSLTNPGGLFARLNAGTISGNLIVNITSDLTSETGAVVLNQQNETGPGGYTILIRPLGGPRVIEGNAWPSVITFNRADRVTINGSLYGEKGLTVRNTAFGFAGNAIFFSGEAVDNSVIGCVLEGSGEIALGVVHIDGGNQGSNISIVGNIIRGREPGPNGQSVEGPAALVAVFGGANTIVADNELSRYGRLSDGSAIVARETRDLVVSGNTIFENSPNPRSLTPILVGRATGKTVISRNVIRDHFTYQFTGIELLENQGTVHVSSNRIYNINNHTSGNYNNALFYGINIWGDIENATVKITNNSISHDPFVTSQGAMSGISENRTAGVLEVAHNTVAIKGTCSNSACFGFIRGMDSAADVSLFGNIFLNDSAGGVGFAVGDLSNGSGSWISDHNLYISAGQPAQNYFYQSPGGGAMDFNTWKGNSSRDTHSIAGLVGTGPFTVEDLFVSAQDLHLNNIANNAAVDAAFDTGLGVDIDGQVRPFGGAPDIGADEAGAAPAEMHTLSGRVTTAAGRGISYARVTVRGGGFTEPITLLTSAFGYFTFDGLRSDEVYLVTVDAKQSLFASPNRILSFPDSDAVVSFTAQQ